MSKNNVIALCIMILLVISTAAADVSVTRNIGSLTLNKQADIVLVVNSSNTNKVDIVEFLPHGWQISSWSTTGISKDKLTIENYNNFNYIGSSYNAYHWKVRDSNSKQFSIDYKITPKETGGFKLISLWFNPEGFNSKTETVTVRAI